MKAHKFILKVRSSVFETMFGENWSQEEPIRISDANPEVFKSFLKFLYADVFVTTVPEAIELFYLGHKYLTNSLLSKCVEFLKSHIAPSNAIGIYRTGILFDEKVLHSKALIYILLHAAKVFKEDEFLSLDIDTLSKFLQYDTLQLVERDVFLAVKRWSAAELERQGLPNNPENIRSLLDPKILPHIRFLQMHPDNFAKEVEGSGILKTDEIILLLKYYISRNTLIKLTLPPLPFNSRPRNLTSSILAPKPHKVRQSVYLYLSSGVVSPNYLVPSQHGPGGSQGRIHTETLEFTVDRDIRIIGIGLYGPGHQCYQNGEITEAISTYEVEVALFALNPGRTGKLTRSTAALVQRLVTTKNDYEVSFVEPKKVISGRLYHIHIAFRGEETKYGFSRISSTKVKTGEDCPEVTFTFGTGFGRHTLLGYNDSPGRIRSIIFNAHPDPPPTSVNRPT